MYTDQFGEFACGYWGLRVNFSVCPQVLTILTGLMSYPLVLGHLAILILLTEILLLQINVRQMFLSVLGRISCS